MGNGTPIPTRNVFLLSLWTFFSLLLSNQRHPFSPETPPDHSLSPHFHVLANIEHCLHCWFKKARQRDSTGYWPIPTPLPPARLAWGTKSETPLLIDPRCSSMGSAAAAALSLLPPGSQMKPSFVEKPRLGLGRGYCRRRSLVPAARLFGPAIFEAAKLKVLFLEVDKENQSRKLPRTYTLTHSDITAKLTLAISQSINKAQFQGWYNKLYRDEVVAEWRKVQGKMSLHVHCHISGGHFLLDFIAKLRYYIFCKELPVVLKAFVHGDVELFHGHPELQDSVVWVYFHSNLPEFNRLECWGPLRHAVRGKSQPTTVDLEGIAFSACPPTRPRNCPGDCSCCFPPESSIPWAHEFDSRHGNGHGLLQQQSQ